MKTTLEARIARGFAMNEEVWGRHANPWSVWTRLLALPLLVLAIWSRAWIGPWSLVAIGLAIAWIWLNPRVFPAPERMDNWASMGVMGERIWMNRRKVAVPRHHRSAPLILSLVTGSGLPFIIYSLWNLSLWPTLMGVAIIILAKLWFVDRMVWLYRDMMQRDDRYRSWLTSQARP